MILSKRLEAITNFVAKDSIVADIGTDHGYIPIYLVENKICKKVIGSDISPGSLEKIIDFVKEKGLEENIDTRLGNGLQILKPFEVDTVIIAGMGGILISEILDKDKHISNSITNFILQPMIASNELRKYLFKNKFTIIDEELVKENNKFYEIIYAIKGNEYIGEDIDLEISNILIKNNHPLLKDFIESKIKLCQSILDEIGDKDTEKSEIKKQELLSRIENYREVLLEIEGD